MTVIVKCDYCGKSIIDGDPTVTISALGSDVTGCVNREVGNYHGEECFEKMEEGMLLVEGHAKALREIPVATGQKIAALRRKHRRES